MTEQEAIAVIRIETDQRGNFRVVDKRGPSVVIVSEHEKHAEAVKAWEAECRRMMAEN